AVCSHEHRGSNDERTGSTLDKGRECCLDVAPIASVRKYELCPERARRCSYITRHLLGGVDRRIRKIAENRCSGNHLVQQIELLAQDLGGDQGRSSYVAAGPVQTGDKAEFHWVEICPEDYRNGRGGCFRGIYSGPVHRDDHGHLLADQIGGKFR